MEKPRTLKISRHAAVAWLISTPTALDAAAAAVAVTGYRASSSQAAWYCTHLYLTLLGIMGRTAFCAARLKVPCDALHFRKELSNVTYVVCNQCYGGFE